MKVGRSELSDVEVSESEKEGGSKGRVDRTGLGHVEINNSGLRG